MSRMSQATNTWATHAVQVERMWATDRKGGDRDLDRRVGRKAEHTALRQKVLSVLRAAEDLEEDRDVRRDEGGPINREVRSALEARSDMQTPATDDECSRSRCQG